MCVSLWPVSLQFCRGVGLLRVRSFLSSEGLNVYAFGRFLHVYEALAAKRDGNLCSCSNLLVSTFIYVSFAEPI